MKSNSTQLEHASRSRSSNIILELLAERVRCAKSHSEYLLPFQWVLIHLFLYFHHGLIDTATRVELPKTEPICDGPPPRWTRRSLAPLQISRRNHRSQVWTEGFSGMVFVVVQKLSLIRYVTLHFRDWRGAASHGHRKRVATTVLMCEHKSFKVWFFSVSAQELSGMVWS